MGNVVDLIDEPSPRRDTPLEQLFAFLNNETSIQTVVPRDGLDSLRGTRETKEIHLCFRYELFMSEM